MAGMDGKVCIITGGTSGIGLVTAETLATKGARVIVVGRDRARTDAALARIKRRVAGATVETDIADLSRLDEVRSLGTRLAALPRIDVLINNAGAMFQRRQTTADRLERTFALNHMAYFVLTELLRGRLVKSAPARVVNVASEAHRGAMLDFDDLQSEHHYRGFAVYARSKLCNILFTRELARRLEGTGVTANCLHPGFVASRFGDDNGGLFRIGITLAKRLLAISVEQGAATSIYLASAPEVEGRSGLYFDKSKPATPSAAARDDAAARQLWLQSARIAGIAA
ncbi:MAG TPA: SDR family oxidoreductase [Xanthobacteraceae bacterium]|nr:SDR family oxidoreductase [Xanthobacteraceae bacterium]